jgi:hypothetical protein
VTVRGEELDRFELHMAARAGYMRVGDTLQPLQAGSRLDQETGEFLWQPGAGFLGSYDLVFVGADGGQPLTRRDVRIVINPKGSNRVGPQIVIDTPSVRLQPDTTADTGGVRLQPDFEQPFTVAGWAIDPDAGIGTGVETLHVWAYPVTCNGPGATCHGTPVFLGAAAYGGRRPDVAAIFGDRFRNSGYGLTVDSLPPGTYDLAVFAWSTATGGFVPARVVRVTVAGR